MSILEEIRTALEIIPPMGYWQEFDNGYEGSDYLGGIQIGDCKKVASWFAAGCRFTMAMS